MVLMRTVFWNARVKKRMVTSAFRSATIDIMCLEETKINNPNATFFRQLKMEGVNELTTKNAIGRSEGIMIGFNNNLFTKIKSWEEKFTLSIRLRHIRDNMEQIVTGVYGPNRRSLRPLF